MARPRRGRGDPPKRPLPKRRRSPRRRGTSSTDNRRTTNRTRQPIRRGHKQARRREMPHVASDSDSSEYDPNQEEKEEEDEEVPVDDAGDDEGEDEEPPPAEVVEVAPPPPPAAVSVTSLPPIESIWESPYIIRTDVNGEPGWRCTHCGFEKTGNHGTRAMYHAAKVRGKGVKICPAQHPPGWTECYRALYDKRKVVRGCWKVFHDDTEESAERRLEPAVQEILAKRIKHGHYVPPHMRKQPIDLSTSPLTQPSIDASLQAAAKAAVQKKDSNLSQSDIRAKVRTALRRDIMRANTNISLLAFAEQRRLADEDR